MSTQTAHTAGTRRWSMLLIYNIYRLINIIVLFGLFWMSTHTHFNKIVFVTSLLFYLLFGLLFLYLCYSKAIKFTHQVLWSGTIDTIVLVLFIYHIGYIQSGLGILLSAPIAMLSILVPGRLAIFFAAVASCMLLFMSIFQYEYMDAENFNTFFLTGVYGAGFFATALTAWYLAYWVRLNENLAKNRGKELENMQRLNEYIIERLQYGVLYVGSDRHIKVMNKAARQFFNLDEYKTDMILDELSSDLYQNYLKFLSRKSEKKSISAQVLLENPYLQVHFFRTSATSNPAVLIILEDMSVISHQAQQLKLASLGRFSASIAHELRNPLGVILHAGELMGDTVSLSEEDSRLRELIINNCHRMDRVIQNVLHVSRRQQAKHQSIRLKQFLNQFKHEFSMTHDCDMILEIPVKKKNTIAFDKSQLEQVLVILCDNAIQHGRDEQGQVHIIISVKHKGMRISISVCDTGPGIPKALLNNVFEPFFTTVTTGTGMGLFIAKDLCEINHARLMIVETLKGCCFEIIFNQNHEIEL